MAGPITAGPGREAETSRRSALLAQISALAQEMERLGQTMAALLTVVPGLEEAARQRFGDPLAGRQADLRRLAERISAGGSAPEDWTSLRQTRQQCITLAREYLAFAQGELARQAGLDGGVLQIADAFIAELSQRVKVRWDPLTVLAETEWYGEEAQIIRLRFPEASIWNLPVAAHEFGHFAGPRLETRTFTGRTWDLSYPVADMLRRELGRGRIEWSRAHEYFADAFAVYLAGPAYACACLLLRFDPGVPNSDGPTHPSYAKRAYLMARTLEKMDQADATTFYVGVVRQLRERWRASMTEAAADGQPIAELEAAVAAEAEPTVAAMWELLQATVPTQRYGGMAAAQTVKAALFSGSPTPPHAVGGSPVTLTDALNAAWLSRLDHWDDDRDATATIAASAHQMCLAIADRRAAE
jgi:hypothetical protein